MGLGHAGLSALEALAARSGVASVRAWDESRDKDKRSLRRSLADRGITLVRDEATALDGVGAVVKSPGIRFDHSLLEAAQRRGIPVLDEFELGWRLSSGPVVAVTGTNGKSTTTALVHAALEAAGARAVLAGNVDFGTGGHAMSSIPAGRDGWVVAEVSSYQAEGCPEFLPSAAIFTNLTLEHLYRHGSMAAYAAAKRRLFVRGDRSVDLAVLNADDPFGHRLAGEVRERGGQTLTYGVEADADYRFSSLGSTMRSGRVEIDTPGDPVLAETRLPGLHNAANLAAALALVDGLGLPRKLALRAFERMAPLGGRFEPIEAGQPYDVVVDYAHTPDGVERTLAMARGLVSGREGRVIVVIGVVGRTHRPTREGIGAAARAGADHLILCGVSRSGEPPLIALGSMLAGAREAEGGTLEVVLERRAAIARGFSFARPGDLVAILGRGPQTRIAFGARGRREFFDDRLVARELLA